MLIAHTRPEVEAVTLSGTGASWLNTDGADTLFDGQPQSVARLGWLSNTGPSAGDYVEVRIQFTADSTLSLLGLASLNLSAGHRIVWFGRIGAGNFDEDLGGTSQSQDTVAMPDATVGQWCLTANDGTLYSGVAFRIYNDVDGAAVLNAASYVDIGEAWFSPTFECDIKRTLQDGYTELTKLTTTLTGQPRRVVRGRARTHAVELAPGAIGATYAAGATVQAVREALVGYAPCVAVPLHRQPGTSSGTDTALLHRQVLFGYASKVGPIQAVEGSAYWQWSCEFTESPN
jgi:hypothetical protein